MIISLIARSVVRWTAGGIALAWLGVAPAGCSDPKPPTPAAAFSVTFDKSDLLKKGGCDAENSVVSVGYADEKGASLVADGENDFFIKRCGVYRERDGLRVTASLVKGSSTRLSISRAWFSEADPAHGEGSVLVQGPGDAGAFESADDAPCTFRLIAGGDLGAVRVGFECPLVRIAGKVGENGCSLSKDYLAMENCEY